MKFVIYSLKKFFSYISLTFELFRFSKTHVAILNLSNTKTVSFDRFYHDVSAFSLAYAQAFVLSLYKRDTTRMVGRHVYSTAIKQ